MFIYCYSKYTNSLFNFNDVCGGCLVSDLGVKFAICRVHLSNFFSSFMAVQSVFNFKWKNFIYPIFIFNQDSLYFLSCVLV